MAAAFLAAGTVAMGGGGSTSTGVLGIPAGIAQNDVLIIVAHSRSNQAHTIGNGATGWAEVTAQAAYGTNQGRLSVWWKRSSGTEDPAPSVDVASAGDSFTARMFAFRGCPSSGNPWDVLGTMAQHAVADGTTVTGDALTTTEADTLIVFAVGSMDNNTWSTPGGGVDALLYDANAAGTDNSICLGYATSNHAAGLQAAPTVVQATLGADYAIKFTIALRSGAAEGVIYTDNVAEAGTAGDASEETVTHHLFTETVGEAAKASSDETDWGPPPRHVGTSSVVSVAGAGNAACPAVSGVLPGDTLVLIGSGLGSTITGFTTPGTPPGAADAFVKVRTASGTGADTPTLGFIAAGFAFVVAYRGAWARTYFDGVLHRAPAQTPLGALTHGYDRSLALAIYHGRAANYGATPTVTSGHSLTERTAQVNAGTSESFRLYEAPASAGVFPALTWTPTGGDSLFGVLILTTSGPQSTEAVDTAKAGDAVLDIIDGPIKTEDLSDAVKTSDRGQLVGEAYLIAAVPVTHGYGTVFLDIPAAALPGDIILLMGLVPDGPSMYWPQGTGWVHSATWNWVRVVQEGDIQVEVRAAAGAGPADANASIGVAMAVFRGVDPGYLPTTANGYALTENGGYKGAPGTYPYTTNTWRNPPFGDDIAFIAPVDDCLVIWSFQSECTDSQPYDHSSSDGRPLTEGFMSDSGESQADQKGLGTSYFWRHGFFTVSLPRAGDTCGYLRWGVTGVGGGWDGAHAAPYPGPAAWFSGILLRPGAFTEVLEDAATAADSAESTQPEMISEIGKTGDAVTDSFTYTDSAADAGQSADTIEARRVDTSVPADASVAGDAATGQLAATSSPADAGAATDSVTSSRVASDAGADAGAAKDQAQAGLTFTDGAAEAGAAGDAAAAVAASGEALGDAAAAGDATEAQRVATETPAEAGTAKSATSDQIVGAPIVEEPADAASAGEQVGTVAVAGDAGADAASSADAAQTTATGTSTASEAGVTGDVIEDATDSPPQVISETLADAVATRDQVVAADEGAAPEDATENVAIVVRAERPAITCRAERPSLTFRVTRVAIIHGP